MENVDSILDCFISVSHLGRAFSVFLGIIMKVEKINQYFTGHSTFQKTWASMAGLVTQFLGKVFSLYVYFCVNNKIFPNTFSTLDPQPLI